jgi:hypothetical protein
MGKVGYGKPPLKSRFKPGQSGNPTGRPKGTVSFRADFAAELAELVSEGPATCTKSRAIVKKLIAEAMSGDTRAAMAVVAFCARLFPEPAEADRQADADEIYLEKLAERERLDAESKDPSIPQGE